MKYRLYSLNVELYNKDILVEKLEQLALKGWKLETMFLSYGVLKKCTPRKIRYAIELFQPYKRKKGSFSQRMEEKEEEQNSYISYCEQAGWNYIGHCKNYVIFASEEQEVVDIQTDQEIENMQMKKELVGNIVPNIILWGFYFFFLSPVRDVFFHRFSYEELLSMFPIILFPILILLMLYCFLPLLADVICFFMKKNKKQALSKGIFTLHRWTVRVGVLLFIGAWLTNVWYQKQWIQLKIVAGLAIFLLFLWCCFIIWKKVKIEEKKFELQIGFFAVSAICFLALSMGVGIFVNKGEVEEKSNWNAKVTMADLFGEGKTTKEVKKESPFLESMTYEGEQASCSIKYTIYKKKIGNTLFEKAFEGEKEELKQRANMFDQIVEPITEEDWGVKEVYGYGTKDTTIERRMRINEEYALSFQMIGIGNMEEEEFYQVIQAIKEKLILPIKEEKAR